MLSGGLFLMTRSETTVTNLVLRYREWLRNALVTSLWLGQNTQWRPLKEGGVSLGSQFHSEDYHGEEVLEHDRMLTLHPPMVGKQRDGRSVLLTSIQSRTEAHRMVPRACRVSLPNSLIWKHRHNQSFVSKVILDPFELTIKLMIRKHNYTTQSEA